jgi:magnesium chelatase family protein
VWTSPLTMEDMQAGNPCESSEIVAIRIEQARAMQQERGVKSNDDIEPDDLMGIGLDTGAMAGLNYACIGLSLRSAHNLMRVARTIADLRESGTVTDDDLMQARELMLIEQLPTLQ